METQKLVFWKTPTSAVYTKFNSHNVNALQNYEATTFENINQNKTQWNK